ncbi:MAG: pyrroloquinoline quinone-dependent dehydrogenase [Caldimonas sp.]
MRSPSEKSSGRTIAALAAFAAAALAVAAASSAHADSGWPAYGGTAEGRRWSDAAQITPANVDGLRRQWLYRTGDLAARPPALMRRIKFETTPILVDDRLVFCTPFNEVIALDPGDGHQLWRYDPRVETDRRPANRYNCRGVAQWRDAAAGPGAACAVRIFGATVDMRLVALDASTGAPCPGFGRNGEVTIDPGALDWPGEAQVTSAPVVAGHIVIVGSAIGDNQRADAPSGAVRAFDARTGAPLWQWDPLVRDAAAPAASRPGAANVWAPMSVDERRGLVFLPTSSPSPDFYGGARPGDNRHADSVVALHAADGTLAWAFQIVRHDVWDYDVPAQPTLATIEVGGTPRDVVVQATKQGFVFVLDRETGQPVFPVEERPVPQGGARGEALAPTQLFPADLPPLVPSALGASDAFGFTPYDRGACAKTIAALRSEGLYTPPSEQGTIVFPFTGGGANWGGVAIDPRGVVYVNTSRAAHAIQLVPRADFAAFKAAHPNREVSVQSGTPFGMQRTTLLSPFGAPCNPPPWGTLAALDLKTKKIVWQSTLGTGEDIFPLGLAAHTGTPNFGGPMATAGGVVFIGAAMDRYLRAFDAARGTELWRGRLPVPGMATPMTYTWHERQYVVIAAGGHGEVGTETSDAIVAFALPAAGEATRSLWDRTIDQPGGRFAARVAGVALGVILLVAFVLRWRRRRRSG